MLETIITTYIDEHQLLPASGDVVVGVSGGADSLCLLHLLDQLCGPGKRYPGVRLHAAHLNHKLRGEAGDRDAAAVGLQQAGDRCHGHQLPISLAPHRLGRGVEGLYQAPDVGPQ